MKSDDIAGFFIDGWYAFDNFAPFQIEWRGKLYPTSEHAYQAAHFIETRPDLAASVRLCRSPRQASDFANKNTVFDDPDWKDKKILFMEEIIKNKLEQHPFIRETLITSGDKYIVEMNDNDEFWGWGKSHDGRNELGKIWMTLRDELSS